jgi:flagellar basal-body rod protein FlgC
MSFFDSLNISATGLTAERMQMDVTSENLANANSTNNGTPYKPQAVELESVGSGNTFESELSSAMGGTSTGQTPGGVEVEGIVNENVPDQLVYDPGNPQANKQGYVKEPDVQPVTEMTNLISESNAYQADVTAMSTSKQMYSDTLQILK